MSDDTPLPPSPGAETAGQDTTTAPPRRRRRAAVAGVGLGVGALVLGGGAFAYSQLSGGGPQPADVMPASTDAYVRIDLDPSAGQKVDLFRLLRQVPEVGESLGIDDPDRDDVRRLVFENIVSDTCDDVSYDEDIEPWLGDRLGIGAEIDSESFLIAAQVDDERAAKQGIDALFGCADEDEYVVDFTEGYALISNDQKSIDASVDAVRDGKTLATSEAFTADMEALGDPGVASVWIDAAGLLDGLAEDPTIGDELDDATRKQIDDLGTLALTLRADGSALELAGVSGTTGDDVATTPIGALPADTVVALSFSGGAEQVSQQWPQIEDAFTSGFDALDGGFDDSSTDGLGQLEDDLDLGDPTAEADPISATTPVPTPTFDPQLLEDLDPETRELYESLDDDDGFDDSSGSGTAFSGNPIEAFEEATGLSLPEDLSTLLGDTFTLAVGAENLETIPTSSGPEDLSKLDIGLRTTGDADAAKGVLQKLADLASDTGVELFVDSNDDGAVLATNADAAKSLTGSGDLGSSAVFQAVMPYGDDTVAALFVDVGTILDKLLEADPPDDVRQDLEDGKAVEAVGVSTAIDGDHAKFSLRVSFAD